MIRSWPTCLSVCAVRCVSTCRLNRRPGTSCVPRTAGQCVSSASAARPHSAQHVMGSNSSSSSFALRQPTCPLLQPPSLQHQQQQPVLLWDGSVLCQDGGAGGVWQGAEHNAGMMAAAGSAAGGAEPQFFPPTHRWVMKLLLRWPACSAVPCGLPG